MMRSRVASASARKMSSAIAMTHHDIKISLYEVNEGSGTRRRLRAFGGFDSVAADVTVRPAPDTELTLMRSMFDLPLAGLALLAVAACSPKAQNETAEAADTVAADANAALVQASNDVEAASDRALVRAGQG